MKQLKALICSIALFAMFAGTAAQAKTEIQWWHAFGGRLGELLNEQVEKFNASQDKYTVVHTRKGNYSETLNAGIAAFRAGQHPNILIVFDVFDPSNLLNVSVIGVLDVDICLCPINELQLIDTKI